MINQAFIITNCTPSVNLKFDYFNFHKHSKSPHYLFKLIYLNKIIFFNLFINPQSHCFFTLGKGKP